MEVEVDVREELALSGDEVRNSNIFSIIQCTCEFCCYTILSVHFVTILMDVQLEKAVVEEMSSYKEEWEVKLDELEKEIAYLLVYSFRKSCRFYHLSCFYGLHF